MNLIKAEEKDKKTIKSQMQQKKRNNFWNILMNVRIVYASFACK